MAAGEIQEIIERDLPCSPVILQRLDGWILANAKKTGRACENPKYQYQSNCLYQCKDWKAKKHVNAVNNG